MSRKRTYESQLEAMENSSPEDEEMENSRDVSKRKRREAGQRSTKVAHALMEMRAAALAKLELHEDIRAAVDRARSMKVPGARRREERRLAGELRRVDLGEVESQLERHEKSGRANARLFQQAEAWRETLITKGDSAVDSFHDELVGLEKDRTRELIANAQREKSHGAPKGAARLLFRYIMVALEAQDQAALEL
jgi:ribosome-associated protein